MKLYDFIFTNESPGKYYRHFAFWFTWFIFFLCKQIFELYVLNESGISSEIGKLSWRPFAVIPIAIFYIYFLIFFLTPLFFVKRQKALAAGVFVITSILTFFNYYTLQVKVSDNLAENIWFHFGNTLGIGPIFIYTLFLSIKMLKNYYLKMEEKEEIERQKTKSEIQFLRAQMHPHFLFNTLNNIYSFTMARSPLASVLVTKLSNTLYYMIQECNTELVPLAKEIKVLTDYIDLEKVRYEKRLDIQIKIEGDLRHYFIAPLIMIPFVENSFKHGVSKMLEPSWIKLTIERKENFLSFELSNPFPGGVNGSSNKNGIGLKNVQKRLALLYPVQHELKIISTDNVFTVQMKIPLQNVVNEPIFYKVNSETFHYA